MLQIQRILFATDYSASAESAFVQAVFLAERFGADLHVLHVTVTARASTSSALPDSAEATGHSGSAVGRRIYQKAWAHGVPVVQCGREAASASEGILKYAEAQNVDLIVLGTHGRRGINRFLMGSVAEQVVRHGTMPVYTVRLAPGPILNHRPRRIVAPIDFSTHSELSLMYAGEIARAARRSPICYARGVEALHGTS